MLLFVKFLTLLCAEEKYDKPLDKFVFLISLYFSIFSMITLNCTL